MKTAIKWLLYLLAFTPLIVDSSVYFPYITGKTMLVRLAVSIAAILYASYLFFSDQFRKEQYARFKKIIKNPITIFTLSFFAIFIISSVFALDTFRAFFGDVERAEGVFGMMYFYVFMMLGALLFEKKDWMNFFRLTLVSGTILFVHEMIQFFEGTVRPSSFTGNPIYLAVFFLFVIMSALIIIVDETKHRLSYWRILAWPIIPLSVVGIFITESRGVIVGIFASILALAVYFAFKGKEIKVFGKINLKTVSLTLMALAVLVGAIFFVTRSSDIWNKIPGFDRLAAISSTDISTQTRLIAFGVGLQSINPAKNSLKEFLIGWGPENFHIAYNIHFDPRYFEFEEQWFDRAHDKLMDVAVMNGMVGLIAYLGLWVSLFWMLAKKKDSIGESAVLIFFGVAYFVQNLFVFDSISTYTPFFVMLAYGIYLTSKQSEIVHQPSNSMTKGEISLIAGSSVVAGFITFAAIAFFLVPYFQMQSFLNAWRSGEAQQVINNLPYALSPYTYAQENIRPSLINYLSGSAKPDNQVWTNLFNRALDAGKEMVQKEPYEPRHDLIVGKTLLAYSSFTNDKQYEAQAEEYFKRAYDLAPKRQDVRFLYAYCLAFEGKNDQAVQLLRDTVALDPKVGDSHYFLGITLSTLGESHFPESFKELEIALSSSNFTHLSDNKEALTSAYESFVRYFYSKRDAADLIQAATRLIIINPDHKDAYQKVIDIIKTGNWNALQLQ